MPTSRQRRTPVKKGRPKPEEAPYTKLVRGVVADEEFGQLYRRAMWSFHREPATQLGVEGEPAADAAAARGLEWFLFGLVMPPKHVSPAEIWIERESEVRGWAEATRREYLTLTTAQYGLFAIESALGDQYFTMTDRLQGGRFIGWNVADVPDVEPGAIVAGWGFPAEQSARSAAGGRQSVVISPGSSVLPPEVFDLVARSGRLAEATPLDVEEAMGGTLEWLTEDAGTARPRFILQDFLDDATGGGVRATQLAGELSRAANPTSVVIRLLDELDPITPVEPKIVIMLASVVWLSDQARSGIEPEALQQRGDRWLKELQQIVEAPDAQPAAPALPAATAALTEHEIVRLRALPLEKGHAWIAEQRLIDLAADGPGGQPYFPECVAVFDAESHRLLALETLAPDEATRKHNDHAILRAVIAAMTSPRVGTKRRPATVRVRSEEAAAQLRALDAIGVAVQIAYVDAPLEEAWAALVEEAETGGAASALALQPAAPAGYLGSGATTPAQLQDLFAAAAAFHAAAPWKSADAMRPFALRADAGARWPAVPGLFLDEEPMLVVGSGPNAREFHLRACLDEDAFEELLSGEEGAPSERPSTITLEFHDEEEVAAPLLAETREHQLALPSRQAIPIARRTEPGAPTRLVAGSEMTLLTVILRVLTTFTKQHGRQIAANPDEIVTSIDVPGFGRIEVRVAPSLEE